MDKNYNQDDIKKFMTRIKELEKGEKLDLSSDEDLSIGIMNLISIEEHLFFTYNKTKDTNYLKILNEVREMRKSLLKMIIKDYEGEVWCISKHLLAGSMRLMEVGTKALTKGDGVKAQDLFEKSYNLYSLFWGLNLGFVGAQDVGDKLEEKEESPGIGQEKRVDRNKEKIVFLDETDNPPKETGSISLFAKLGEIVKKAVDCCKE